MKQSIKQSKVETSLKARVQGMLQMAMQMDILCNTER